MVVPCGVPRKGVRSCRTVSSTKARQGSPEERWTSRRGCLGGRLFSMGPRASRKKACEPHPPPYCTTAVRLSPTTLTDRRVNGTSGHDSADGSSTWGDSATVGSADEHPVHHAPKRLRTQNIGRTRSDMRQTYFASSLRRASRAWSSSRRRAASMNSMALAARSMSRLVLASNLSKSAAPMD